MTRAGQAIKAKPRERMIELKVRFFTNGMDRHKRRGYIVPKHAWINGSVVMDRNESHQIIPGRPKMFNSLMEIPAAIERVLISHNIKLHNARHMAEYIE